MPDQVETLKQLQAIDAELFKLRRQQREKPRELEQAKAALAEAEVRMRAFNDRIKALQLSQKEKEIELQAREANVKKLQAQLFQVKTNKEYTAMQREIDSLKTDNSVLEEGLLQAFDGIDQATKERQQEQQRLAVEQARFAAERARIEADVAAIAEQLAVLERRRQGVAPQVPATTLAVYERVLQLREGLALVPLLNETCGGCYRRLPPQVVNEVHLKATLVTCESCNRILYVDETHSQL